MTGNCFSESTPFFLQYTRASGEMWGIEKKKAGERSETETEWEEWEGRANFHNEKVIICGVRVSFSLVSVACQLLARGHCVAPAMHTNSLTKPRPRGLPLLKNVSFTFLLPSHLSNPINPHPHPTPPSTPSVLSSFSTFYSSFTCSIQGGPIWQGRIYKWIIYTRGIPHRPWNTIPSSALSHLFYSYIVASIGAAAFSSDAHKHTHTIPSTQLHEWFRSMHIDYLPPALGSAQAHLAAAGPAC